jgi:hypothetical protein
VATKNPAQGIGFGRRLSGVPKSLGGPWLTVWEVRLGLSDPEEDALVAFMQTLTDGFMPR